MQEVGDVLLPLERVDRLLEADVGADRAPLARDGEVGSGREGPLARAREDDDAHVPVGGRAPERLRELLQHLGGERVHALGAVDGDGRDAVADLVEHHVGHSADPPSGDRAGAPELGDLVGAKPQSRSASSVCSPGGGRPLDLGPACG